MHAISTNSSTAQAFCISIYTSPFEITIGEKIVLWGVYGSVIVTEIIVASTIHMKYIMCCYSSIRRISFVVLDVSPLNHSCHGSSSSALPLQDAYLTKAQKDKSDFIIRVPTILLVTLLQAVSLWVQHLCIVSFDQILRFFEPTHMGSIAACLTVANRE